MNRAVGLCLMCEHFDASSCTAYPDGIPNEILYEGFDHRKPAPGDNGIMFQPAQDIAPDVMVKMIAKYESDFPPTA